MNSEYHAKCRARRQQVINAHRQQFIVIDAAVVEAAHAEALEMNNAMALVKIADDCLTALSAVGCNVPAIIADWNVSARLAGFTPLTLSANAFQHMTRAQIGQILAFRKTILDIKVNP